MNAATFIRPPEARAPDVRPPDVCPSDARPIMLRRAVDGEQGRARWSPALGVRRIWKVSGEQVVFESAASLRPGDVVELGVANARFQQGRVVWVRNGLCSCRIDVSGRLLTCLRDAIERCRHDAMPTALPGPVHDDGDDGDVARDAEDDGREADDAAVGADDALPGEAGDFARFLCACRRQQQLTRMDLARRLAVSKVTVWKWETGKALPRARRIRPLAETLAMSERALRERIRAATLDREA